MAEQSSEDIKSLGRAVDLDLLLEPSGIHPTAIRVEDKQ